MTSKPSKADVLEAFRNDVLEPIRVANQYSPHTVAFEMIVLTCDPETHELEFKLCGTFYHHDVIREGVDDGEAQRAPSAQEAV